MNWKDEQERMETAMSDMRAAFQGLIRENRKLRKMNAELYDHASDDMELEQLRELNKQLFTLAGMPSEIYFPSSGEHFSSSTKKKYESMTPKVVKK